MENLLFSNSLLATSVWIFNLNLELETCTGAWIFNGELGLEPTYMGFVDYSRSI